MKLRIYTSIWIFISAYSPLTIILAIRDWDSQKCALKHLGIIISLLCVSIISCLILWLSLKFLKSSEPPVTIIKVHNCSSDLINFSIPYVVSFFALNLEEIVVMLSFVLFMIMMWWMTIKTNNIFTNPILALFNYTLYTVTYKTFLDDVEHEATFLVKGNRLHLQERCHAIELSEQFFLVTKRTQKDGKNE
jgi:hypothetical protein